MTAEEKLYKDGTDLETQVFKCPNCGGKSVFSPENQKLKCLYCDTLFDIEGAEKVNENNIDELLSKGSVWKETEVYQCNNCGAKQIIPKQGISMHCSFCGTTNIVKTSEMSGLKPQGVVTFKIEKENASIIALKWIKRKWYAPKKFKSSANPENINGIFNPAFTFDSSTFSTYNGVLGKNHTTFRNVNGKTIAHTELRTFPIKGEHKSKFDDVLVQASESIPYGTLAKVEPFATNDAIKYKEAYLSGYVASTYSKDGNFAWLEGQNIINRKVELQILSKYSYDVKVSFNLHTNFFETTYKYILVPIYVGHYTYNQKLYNFFINGSNGKITGKYPISKWKVFFTILAGLILIGGAIAIYYLASN